MQYSDEKDYIMRMIKELASVLFSLMLKKDYVQVELPEENAFTVSGRKLDEYKTMIDHGKINEAENLLLDNIDYENPDEIATAVLFYQYISEKSEEFLNQHSYTQEEVLDGLRFLAQRAGYADVCNILN